MRLALVGDAYPPLRTSGAVQMRDLAEEFVRLGHEITVIVPSAGVKNSWMIEAVNGVQVLRLSALRTKDIGYVRRTLAELLMPFAMLRNIRKSPLGSVKWDAVVWYSPSIFFGPLVAAFKRATNCRSYLVLRDIFPEWAVDMKLMRRGLAYRFFKLIERYQYSVADTIGVQSAPNLGYVAKLVKGSGTRLEVLHNWLAQSPNVGASISVAATTLSGRTILVYAGNMGVAQGMDLFLSLAERLRDHRNVGFLFVGRGSEVPRLRANAKQRSLDNVVFNDEIEPSEIPGLLQQCHIGLVALDPRHKTHNIPGKFLAYIQAGLPVLARLNVGNDLADLIYKESVGRAYVGESLDAFAQCAQELVENNAERALISARARALATRLFSPTSAANKILSAVSCGSPLIDELR